MADENAAMDVDKMSKIVVVYILAELSPHLAAGNNNEGCMVAWQDMASMLHTSHHLLGIVQALDSVHHHPHGEHLGALVGQVLGTVVQEEPHHRGQQQLGGVPEGGHDGLPAERGHQDPPCKAGQHG